MTKFYAQEKRVFDISKITVVGSPTISEDGVASGFSSENKIYAEVCDGYDLSAHTYTLKLHLPKVSTIGTSTMGVSFRLFQAWCELGTQGYAWLKGYNGTSNVNLCHTTNKFTDGDDIDLIIQYRYNDYTITMSVNGGEYGDCIKYSETLAVQAETKAELYLGSNVNYSPYQGEIPLASVEFYIDNQLIYSPTKPICYLERRKEGFDLSKFTVVGSPTITEDGVASGFNADNYVTANLSFNSSNYIIEVQFLVPDVLGVEYTILQFHNTSRTRVIIGASTNLVLYDNTLTSIITYSMANFKGHTIKCRFEITPEGSKLTIDDLTQGKTYTTTSVNTLTLNEESYVTIGKGINSTTAYLNSIDLPSFSITVDDKEVFTGAKEKFYAMKGGM